VKQKSPRRGRRESFKLVSEWVTKASLHPVKKKAKQKRIKESPKQKFSIIHPVIMHLVEGDAAADPQKPSQSSKSQPLTSGDSLKAG
jgi:hypothetical protein